MIHSSVCCIFLLWKIQECHSCYYQSFTLSNLFSIVLIRGCLASSTSNGNQGKDILSVKFLVIWSIFFTLWDNFWDQDEAQNCFGVYSYRLITFVLQAWLKSTSFILFRTAGWTVGEVGFNASTAQLWLGFGLGWQQMYTRKHLPWKNS